MNLLMTFGANIFIASAGTYFIFKMIPYQINPKLLLWRKTVIILLILIINFLLMNFAFELPDGVRLDLRYVSIILIAVLASPLFTISTAALIGLARFLLGNVSVSLQAFLFIMVLAVLASFWTYMRKNKVHESRLIFELYIISVVVNLINMSFFYGFHFKLVVLAIIWMLFNGLSLLLLYGVLYDMRHTRHLYIIETERAFTDALTNLSNRRAFDQHIRLHSKDVTVKKLSALMLDIDLFKSVNDTYGHPAGDKVLQSCASIIQEHCFEKGHAYRLGGEEFCILGVNFDQDTAFKLAEKIRLAIQHTPIPIDAHQKIAITISIGVATAYLSTDFEYIHHFADKALYEAKNNGRNQTISL
ncbi:diguanylate cyclase [Listeria fleischmannii 1991]|uniref:Diguanylate cyclase n=2 Tax=Listeria fleischmannii TaxID=1069827 RepID=A0A0J8G6M8_9LIST|nr:GGDEF domain-containing protein [Listeria fleischmannii]EMG28741.1 diguanylate cyclase [Listeria fleischmannii subsp. fleischmannii LU2006-1]KMT58242.1 diguanylate cyclase [Listeria fleischmannii 1991]SQC70482.1 Probable diguanylate cyclase YcdT [Listeria fleischmannii subsp. fleischmannii]